MRTAQRLGGRHDITGVDAGANVGRRERDRLALVVFGNQRHALDGEAESVPGLAQGRNVAGRFLAEREVLADDHLDHVQPFHQQFVDVAVRGELHEIGGEGHDEEDIDTQFLGQFGTSGQRRQLRGMVAGEDDFHRMRVEGHQHRRHTAGPAAFTARAISSA